MNECIIVTPSSFVKLKSSGHAVNSIAGSQLWTELTRLESLVTTDKLSLNVVNVSSLAAVTKLHKLMLLAMKSALLGLIKAWAHFLFCI